MPTAGRGPRLDKIPSDRLPLERLDEVLPPDSPLTEALWTPLLLDFEGLTTQSIGRAPTGYGGFDWSILFDLGEGGTFEIPATPELIIENYYPGTGYQTGSIDPGDYTGQIWDRGMELVRSDQSDFIFDSVYLTSAWLPSVEVTLTGYNDGVVVGTYVATIGNAGPTFVDVDWGPIDQLQIVQTSEEFTNLVLDNALFHI